MAAQGSGDMGRMIQMMLQQMLAQQELPQQPQQQVEPDPLAQLLAFNTRRNRRIQSGEWKDTDKSWPQLLLGSEGQQQAAPRPQQQQPQQPQKSTFQQLVELLGGGGGE